MSFTRTFAALAVTMLAGAGAAAAQTVPHFIAPQTYNVNTTADGPSMYWSATGDFNGDGRVDMAAPDLRILNNLLGFSVAFGGPGGFAAPVTRSVGAFVRAVRAADFNHDGRADLLLVTLSGAAVVQGNADGTFGDPLPVFVPLTPNDATIADFNGDGNADVVFAGDAGYAVVIGNADGTFARGPWLREATASYGAYVGDFNHDGAQDFTGAGGIFGHTYFGNGDGTFQAPIDAGSAINAPAVSGDFNGDGNIDFVMPSATPRQDGSNYGFRIAVGFGDGTFSAYIGYVLSQQPISNVASGDFNEDGLSDLAVSYNGTLHVMKGDAQRWLAGDLLTADVNNGVLFSADLDGNGSNDLLISNSRDYTVFRSTHGNPPLLASLTIGPAFTLGGVSTAATVTLGGAAPEGGATITLATSDGSIASFPGGATMVIPAGASSATVDIATAAVLQASAVTISGEWNGVTQSAVLSVGPAYSLSGFTISPDRQYGIFTARGTLTLTAPADTMATVQLSSSNPDLASVPVQVTVPAGATSVDFTITLTAVTADTPVTITASRGDVSLTSSMTVLAPADSLAITKAILVRKNSQLDVEATSTSSTTTVTVYNAATGAMLGTLQNSGNGKYKGSVFLFLPANAPAPTIVLKSALGGTKSGTVQVK